MVGHNGNVLLLLVLFNKGEILMNNKNRHNNTIPWKRFLIMSIFIILVLFIFSSGIDIFNYFNLFSNINDVYIQKFFELISVIIVTVMIWVTINV